MKVRCKSCNEINNVDYMEIIPNMRANHFHKLTCKVCGRKTLITYKYDLNLIDQDDITKTVQAIQDEKTTIQ